MSKFPLESLVVRVSQCPHSRPKPQLLFYHYTLKRNKLSWPSYCLQRKRIGLSSHRAQALAREPRHFGALTGLGMMLQEMGEDKRALQAFRRALEIDPHLQKIPEFVKALTDKVEGRDI